MNDRRGDWEGGVDENLASLNAGQLVWDREAKISRQVLHEIDNLLRGDPEKDTDGMVARLHQIENEVALLKAVLLKDKAGNKGIVGRVETLEAGETRADRRMKTWVAVIGLISALTVATVWNLDRIEAFLHKRKPDPVEQMIEKVRHPKGKHRHVVIREEPEPAED